MGGDNDEVHDPYDATAIPINEEEEESDEINEDAVSNGRTRDKGSKKSGEFGKRAAVPWDAENFDSDGEGWSVQDEGKESPSVWDPDSFVKQTGNLGNWNDSGKKHSRIQDLPSPAVAEPTPEQRKAKEDEEEWPFKNDCAFEAKKSKGRNFKSTQSTESASSDIDSVESPGKARRGKRDDDEGPDDTAEGWKKGSDGKYHKASRKNRSAPSMPKRSSGRPDAEDTEGNEGGFQDMKEDADKPLKPKRRSKSKDRCEENDEDDELQEGSFHNLANDMDKPRSRSKGRKPRSGKRRPHKDTSEVDDDDYEEFGGDETTEQKLKGEDDAPGSSGAPRKSWRQRRADNRARENSMSSDSSDMSGDADHRGKVDRAPSSAGGRPPRRAMMRRAQSERWKKNVDSDPSGLIESDAITRRAKASLANAELSRSAHSIRRYHSGGLHRMTGGVDRRAYGDRPGGFERLERRARKKKSNDELGTASYHGLSDDYEHSGRSQRTLDSIEDLEDFEHIDFQTPGMVDIEDEIWELMQRANPEETAHLERRVQRQRGKMAYDQNMPLMTRQALMTRQHSSQVMRGRVDASNIDRRRLLIRADSNASMGSTDELSFSQHRARYSTTPGRRAPPRSRSSGLAAMAAQSMARAYEQQQQQDGGGDDRRKLFRNRSTSTNSFRQYLNKPNKVAQASRRGPGSGDDEIGTNSMRGPSSGGAERRKPVQRAKSTTALRRPQRTDMRRSPRRGDGPPKSIDTRRGKDVSGLKSPTSKDDDSIDSDLESENSSVESMGGEKSPRKAYRKPSKAAASAVSATKKSPPLKSPKSKKRDMKRKSHRRKLHALLYESKMGVTMKDLHKQIKKPDDKDAPAPLMITAP